MTSMFKKLNILMLSIILLAAFACSDNSTKSGGEPGKGEGSFTISGDLEGEKTGISNFRAFEMSGVHTWDINILDQNPITYTIDFRLMSDEPIERPQPGTYELSTSSFDGTTFSGTYTFFEDNQMDPDGYIVGLPGSDTEGTLIITSSSEDLVEGTYQFTAKNIESGGTITVSNGEFSAVPRINSN